MIKSTVLCTGPDMAPVAYEKLRELGYEALKIPANSAADTIDQILAGADSCDAFIVRTGKITDSVISSARGLKIIVKHGIGIDNIDLVAATTHGIPVVIIPDAMMDAVAELAVGFVFCGLRNIHHYDRSMREGSWDRSFGGISPRKKTLGLIGLGRIARKVVELLRPLAMRVVAFDAYLPSELWPEGVTRAGSLHELLRMADVISIHCPKTTETVGLIGKAEIELMKPSAYLINTARGAIIDEAALRNALNSGRIAGAALDTYEMEPLPPDDPLRVIPNVILTPHIASATSEALEATGLKAVEIVHRYVTARVVDYERVMNPEVLTKNAEGKERRP